LYFFLFFKCLLTDFKLQDNFGFGKLEVIDNGSGVAKEDVLKMALPHYTSKISQHEDLDSLTSYGFRGEALAAICAIGKLGKLSLMQHNYCTFRK